MANFREWRGLPDRGHRLRGLDEMPVRTSWHGANSPLNRRRRRSPLFSVEIALVATFGVSAGLAFAAFLAPTTASFALLKSPSAAQKSQRAFGFCHTGGGQNCVVDGDTFWMDGQKIRIADIDTPETHPSRCAKEEALGNRATQRLQGLLNAGPVTLETIDRDSDKYGRALRIVTRDGQSLGEVLIAEGLARPWEGYRRPWCT